MRATTRSGEPSRVSGRYRASRWRSGPAVYAARLAGNQRAGFTLVELLVAISIIVLLAGLTVAFLPSAMEQQRAADGAVQLQRWLSVAQQRARRDQAGRGLRLIAGSAVNSTEPVPNPLHVTVCQYLEQPDDYFVQGSYISRLTGTTVTLSPAPTLPPPALPPPPVDFYQGQTDPTLWAVFQRDSFEVSGGGVVHSISQVSSSTSLTLVPTFTAQGVGALSRGFTQITMNVLTGAISKGCYLDIFDSTAPTVPSDTVLVTNIQNTNTAGQANVTVSNTILNSHTIYTLKSHGIATVGIPGSGQGPSFRIIRAPRVTGDEVLEFPPNVVVDLATNSMYDSSHPLPLSNGTTGNLDIMFAPNGAATAPQISKGILALWVRDLTAGPNANEAAEFQLGPTIIAVYLRTGFVAAHPPNSPPNVYQFLTGGGAQ